MPLDPHPLQRQNRGNRASLYLGGTSRGALMNSQPNGQTMFARQVYGHYQIESAQFPGNVKQPVGDGFPVPAVLCAIAPPDFANPYPPPRGRIGHPPLCMQPTKLDTTEWWRALRVYRFFDRDRITSVGAIVHLGPRFGSACTLTQVDVGIDPYSLVIFQPPRWRMKLACETGCVYSG